MTDHPIQMRGYDFKVTFTDGGWVPEAAHRPEISKDIPVGRARACGFAADNLGERAIHYHQSHHTKTAMGRTAKSSMPFPDNTIPMMADWDAYVPFEKEGIFPAVQVRNGVDAVDCPDPGWYENPSGKMACEWICELPEFAMNNGSKNF